MTKHKEIRFGIDDSFFCEVWVDEDGEVSIGRRTGKAFHEMKLSTFYAKVSDAIAKEMMTSE